jgi:hypothetical protein
MLVTGLAMVLAGFGLGGLNWAVYLMALFGLVMAGIFVGIYFGPWAGLRGALADADPAAAPLYVGRIRTLIAANLGLGLITVAIAAFAG